MCVGRGGGAKIKVGALRIRDINYFDLVLIKKWIWRYFNELERLWVRMFESKYGELESGLNRWNGQMVVE